LKTFQHKKHYVYDNIILLIKKYLIKSVSDYKNLLFRVMKCIFIALKTKSRLILLLLFVTFPIQGQNSKLLNINSLNGSNDVNISSLIDHQIQYLKSSYYAKIEVPNEIINGKEYESYYRRSQSKPLLFPNKKRTATLFTRTRQYKKLYLQYDTFHDEVIYTDESRILNDRFPQISLNKDIADGFNLYFDDDSLIFKYFRLPECNKLNLKEGFYEIGYQGRSRLVIKHRSTFYQREGLNEYKYDPEYYVSTGDVFSKIKSRKSLIKLFGERSGVMKKYLHESRIRMRQADRNQFADILKHYDSLSISSKQP
jgi:hypothetical protein